MLFANFNKKNSDHYFHSLRINSIDVDRCDGSVDVDSVNSIDVDNNWEPLGGLSTSALLHNTNIYY